MYFFVFKFSVLLVKLRQKSFPFLEIKSVGVGIQERSGIRCSYRPQKPIVSIYQNLLGQQW